MDREYLLDCLIQASDNCPALTICYCREYLEVTPDDGLVWLYLGIALVELARYDEAENALTKAIDFCPPEKLQIPLSHMGHLFNHAGDYDRAASWYHEAIEADPNDASYHIYLGGVLAKQGRLREAEESHRVAITCEDGCVDEAYLNLGFILRAMERFSEAAECFREALRRDPEYKVAQNSLHDVLRAIQWREINGK